MGITFGLGSPALRGLKFGRMIFSLELSHLNICASDLHQLTLHHTRSMTQIIEEETFPDADAADKGPYDQFILLSVYIYWIFFLAYID